MRVSTKLSILLLFPCSSYVHCDYEASATLNNKYSSFLKRCQDFLESRSSQMDREAQAAGSSCKTFSACLISREGEVKVMDLFCPPGMVYSKEKELCAESPVPEEDCRADLDTWNKKFLNMLKEEKKEEKRQMLTDEEKAENTQGKTPKPVLNFREQKEQWERNQRQEQLLEKSNSYNNLFGKLI